MVVTKLAAILRVADALDNSHNQEASHYRFFRNEDQLCFMIRRPGELNAARLALKEKARLFEQIFGLNIVPMTQAQRK